jgi:alkylation response protein AidB-like acyl-CoA dehydrogenase
MSRTPIAPAETALAQARALAPLLVEQSATNEQERRLSARSVEALTEAGLFAMSVPARRGGGEVDLATQLRVLEEIAQADSAAAWCVMIASTTALAGSYLADEGGAEIYGANPLGATSGVYAPRGAARRVEGGLRVTGRWPFSSGCEHSAWRLGGVLILGEKGPLLLPDGTPDLRLAFFPAADTRVVDTWRVMGLRGTGSHDVEVEDVFVPERRTFSPLADASRVEGALYAFPLFGFLALEVAAVALGIARAALGAFTRLARDKTPMGARRTLAQRGVVQREVAEAEALVRAARAFLYDAVGEAWDRARAGDPVTMEQRGDLRLAATHAVANAAAAVDLVYHAGGGTSIYAESPLERHFRDVHVVTQHAMVGPAVYEVVGRLLLGAAPGRAEL